MCETVNGNWAQLDMTGLGASTTVASLALTAFWAMVTAGRILFAVVQRRFPARRAYHLLPFVLTVALVLISLLPDDAPALGVLAFGLAGLDCSALLPLTISLGQGELTAISASVAGGVIAFLPARLRHRRVRRRAPGERRRRPADDLRARRNRRGGHGRPVVRRRRAAPRARLPPPAPGVTPPARPSTQGALA